MTEPAQVAKSVTHVPGRKCNPCIGTFKKRTETGSKVDNPAQAPANSTPQKPTPSKHANQPNRSAAIPNRRAPTAPQLLLIEMSREITLLGARNSLCFTCRA